MTVDMTQNADESAVSEMAHAYTPGLKVKRVETIRKIRKLPIKGDVLIKNGDKVDFRTIVAETMIPGEPHVVKASVKLGVTPELLKEYLIKYEGDKVEQGERICGFNAFFGLWKNWVESPIDGYIETVSHATGQIILREEPVPISVEAYIPGEVIEVMEGEGAVIVTRGATVQGVFGVGGETQGEIKVLAENPQDHLTADDITPDCNGKVVIGGALATRDALHRAADVGVAGLVVGGIRDTDLEDLLGYEVGVAVTGQEEIGLTLIITEGFGEMAMNPRTLELLSEFEGEMAAINGTTQIRAGVIRPEIIIPHGKYAAQEAEEELAGGMKAGTPIRVIREPYFGALGIVVGLPVELQRVESESMVRVVEIELEGGERVVVPRANVEIIET